MSRDNIRVSITGDPSDLTRATETDQRPPRDNLFRAVYPGVEVRAAEEEGRGPILHGHFARFNEWTEIDSVFEGHFMERFAPGAFSKTLSERSPKVLFQHGRDGQLGDKPLGTLLEAREDDAGAYYEVELFDGVPDLLIDGLRAGVYGASFRFNVMREDKVKEPGESDHNPRGITERTVREALVPEFGPVTFPAYEGATAGVRSLTDEFLIQHLATQPERLRRLIEWLDEDPQDRRNRQDNPVDADDGHLDREQGTEGQDAPPQGTPDTSTSPKGRRDKGLVLPRAPRAAKSGVLPRRDEGESWSPMRLP